MGQTTMETCRQVISVLSHWLRFLFSVSWKMLNVGRPECLKLYLQPTSRDENLSNFESG